MGMTEISRTQESQMEICKGPDALHRKNADGIPGDSPTGRGTAQSTTKVTVASPRKARE